MQKQEKTARITRMMVFGVPSQIRVLDSRSYLRMIASTFAAVSCCFRAFFSSNWLTDILLPLCLDLKTGIRLLLKADSFPFLFRSGFQG
jgi:hypothetical protein